MPLIDIYFGGDSSDILSGEKIKIYNIANKHIGELNE